MSSAVFPTVKVDALDDAYHLEQSLNQLRCDISINQLSRGSFQGSITRIVSEELQLLQVQLNRRLHAAGAKPSNSFIFAIPLVPIASRSVTHAIPLPKTNCIFGFDEQRETDLVTPPNGYNLALVIVSKRLFFHYAAAAGRYDLDDAFMRRNLVQVASHQYLSLVKYLREVFYVCQHQPAFMQLAGAAQLLEKDLLPLLIQTLNIPLEQPKLRPSRRADLVVATQQFMAANLQRPLTLDDICREVCSSKRALTYGFQDHFEMAPMAFLKAQRLNGVRRALLNADPNQQTVVKLAQSWGFWSMGHFARDYKAMFGESPSDTLTCEQAYKHVTHWSAPG